ncbi:MAG: hypothetical protein JNG90_09580 [Planctomycetaceae bacterium]|nr:hypothetical protein [Planctomycetaceae bacterium]
MFKAMSALFVVGVLSISMAIGQQETPPAAPATEAAKASAPAPMPAASGKQEPCCGDSTGNAKRVGGAPPPCVCPLYPLYPLGGGQYVYYCSRFAEDCDDTPTGAYLYGQLTYPLACSGGLCPAETYRKETSCKSVLKGAFPGFPRKFDLATHEHEMPLDGTARLYARRLVDPKLQVIAFTDIEGNARWAKVFTYTLDLRGAHARLPEDCQGDLNDPALQSQVIYFAAEVEKPEDPDQALPEGFVDVGQATPLNEKSEPTANLSFVYLGTCPTTGGKPISILILCAR